MRLRQARLSGSPGSRAQPSWQAPAGWHPTGGRSSSPSLSSDEPQHIIPGDRCAGSPPGDIISAEILARSAAHLAQGIAIYASLLDISHFVVGGEVAELGEVYFTPFTARWNTSAAKISGSRSCPAELKQETFLRGISMLTLQEVLRSRVNHSAINHRQEK